LVADGFERCRIALTESAGHAVSGSSGRGREKQKPNAPMNGKDATLVVEADECVDVAVVQQPGSQSRAAVIGCEARRQDKADPSARPCERHRALEKELIAVRMAVRLRRVDA